ncbi:Non-structural maintenance of chromosome element 3 [Naviculisporaceae sp. PSN 640]
MPPPSQRARRRQAVDEYDEEDTTQQIEDEDEDGDDRMHDGERDETSQLIKKLVRYALACEFSRTPIRRDGIKEKVLGSNGREFKKVFAGAQRQLRAAFGMEMVELPTRDRNLMTTEQKRKAAKSQSQKEPTSNAYVLVSILPEQYRTPAIIAPSKVQSADGEASYVALYSIIISIITLSGGELSDPRLRRHLARLNAAENMPSANPTDGNAPSEKTELVLQKMIKQGYLVKVAEPRTQGDEEAVTWHVGPRGKVEVNNESIASLVRTVYGGSNDVLESKLQTSLKVKDRKTARPANVEEREEQEEEANGDPGPSRSSNRRRSGRRAAAEEMDED